MTADELLQELSTALAEVEPSADFSVRVRARVDATSRATVAGVAWRHVFLGGVVTGLATGLLVVVSSRLTTRPVVVGPPEAVAAVMPSVAPAPTLPGRLAPERATAPRAMSEPTRLEPEVSLEPTLTEMAGHEVIVPADQRLALARLLDAVSAGHGRVPRNLVPLYDAEGLLLGPPRIVVAPLALLSGAAADDAPAIDPRQSLAKDRQR
jgi:hypothetical protein